LQIYPSSVHESGGKKSWASHPPSRGNNQHLEAFEKKLMWAIKLVEREVPPFKFYFVKIGIEDTIRQMPIHDMARWAPSLDNVILFYEDPSKKQLVGLMCLGKKLDVALILTNIRKGFEAKDIQDLDAMVVLEKWIKFKELIELGGKTP
jgi:hypothetical protein